MATSPLQFVPLQSAVDTTFWTTLANKKLDELKLSEAPIAIIGDYSVVPRAAIPAFVRVDHAAFQQHAHSTHPGHVLVQGTLYNFNTWEGFKNANHKDIIRQAAQDIWFVAMSDMGLKSPQSLCRMVLLSYADLKGWQFYYWFAFPAIKLPSPILLRHTQPLTNTMSPPTVDHIKHACTPMLTNANTTQPVALLVNIPVDHDVDHDDQGTFKHHPTLVPLTDIDQHKAALSAWSEMKGLETKGDGGPTLTSVGTPPVSQGGAMVVVVDAQYDPTHPAWPLRNVLAMLAARLGGGSLRVLCLRGDQRGVDVGRCRVLDVVLPALPDSWHPTDATGWEIGLATPGKPTPRPAPRHVDMRATMDPTLLAAQAVDLNVRLMCWRFAPGLNTQRLAQMRCLLLGAGTLGCAVARTLLGWGIRHITFVDSGKVSFSNPVRQSLFTYQDCLQGGRPKAAAAAAAIQAIFPAASTTAVDLTIPMPGHALTTDEEPTALTAAADLEALIVDHDAVFLLTDTREARWLPTMLAAKHNTLAITAGLAFDTFVVVRHGVPNTTPRLGCYFCNDVVAPQDSTRDRSLDQQCTVTRPGLAFAAAAVAGELCVNVVQHPMGVRAPHVGDSGGDALGAVPHMVRGYVSSFTQTVFHGHAYERCPACSPRVVAAYEQQGPSFLLGALRDPGVLEKVTGLAEMHAAMDAMLLEEEDKVEEEGGRGKGKTEGDEEEEEDWTTL